MLFFSIYHYVLIKSNEKKKRVYYMSVKASHIPDEH